MELRSITAIARPLQTERVRSLVVGGLAVVVHGYVPATADMDIVLDVESGNVASALRAFERLGYRPRAPVPLQAFADPAQRASWSRQHHMVVFSLSSLEHDTVEVALFLAPPFDFAKAYAAATACELESGLKLSVVALDDLLRLNRAVAGERDLLDMDELESCATSAGTPDVPDSEHCWEEGWQGHERAQRRRMARWPLERKLRWLEEINAIARKVLGEEGFRRARERQLGLRRD
jgi:hypothetical protein